MDRAGKTLALALEYGFDLAGVARLQPPRDADRFERWLLAGHQADMDWLERNKERILDPARVRPTAKSLLVVGIGHARDDVSLPGGGRIARYAAGRDYHNLVTRRLKKLAKRLEAEGLAGGARAIVDAGPLLERSHAAEAGIGFASKAANLLHPRFGPWFFLGELLLDAELEPTSAPPAGSCGTCTACLDACPTGALPEPGVLDANLCLSYHTIENRGAVPHALREPLGDWAFGCDICSEVCPWGQGVESSEATWGTHPVVAERSLVDWLRIPNAELKAELNGSPLQRARVDGLKRNAALVLGNRPSDDGRDALRATLATALEPRVRAAAFWGLAQGHGADAGIRSLLERALATESDAEAAEDMRTTLARG